MSVTRPPGAEMPTLTMLWESEDPQAALTRRFGFTGVDQATEWLATILARHWDLELKSCDRLVISAGNALAWVTTDRCQMVVKWSVVARFYPRLAEHARLTAWLGERGLPVSSPVPSRDGHPQVEVDGVSIGLQEVVDGVHLDVDDAEQVRMAGKVLAHLHTAMVDYPDADRIAALSGRPSPESLNGRIAQSLESFTHERLQEATKVLREALHALRSAPPLTAQLIHNDFRSANILCRDGRIAAVLDFEEVAVDHRVFDLARSAVLLGTRFRNWGPVAPETHETLVAGYQSIRPLSPTEEAWLRVLILWRTMQAVPGGDDPAGWIGSVERLAEASL
ncbi:phosphotransferase [Actinopolymorpha alba]|uniref:phosphotransferase n=1 Tax=Actinopolymorpha alba TaxID=533267 RepID=UPI00039EEC2D|nr:phosphotransferase [Actinopolymorpha alba]